MKTFKYLPFWLCMLMMCVTFSSCSDDDDPKPDNFPVGTRWTFTESFQEDDWTITADYSITFMEATATYQILYTYRQGTATQTESDYATYTYTYSDNFVVMKPQTPNFAYLEGKITSGVKMEVKNVSSGEIIGVFYKQ